MYVKVVIIHLALLMLNNYMYNQILVKADTKLAKNEIGSNPCNKPCTTCPYMLKTTSITLWKMKQ